jgi:hypothetical protein
MVFLGTMREYFSYGKEFGCSFPSVTLLGELRPARRRGRAAVLEQRGAPGGRGLVGRPDDAVGVADGVLLVACRWEEGEGLYNEDLPRAWFRRAEDGGCRRLVLDGVEFPVINMESIPAGIVRVPLTVYQPWGEEEAVLLAGSMGMEVLIEEDDEIAVRPASGWWMLETL